MKHRNGWLTASIVLVMAALACNLPSFGPSTPPAEATLAQLYTAAALTVQAASSPGAGATPTFTATSSFPTFPTLGPSRTAAPVTLCDVASFVADVSIPDGTSMSPNAAFTKTWRIRNIGSCSWTQSYALVFVSGDRMGAPHSLGLPGNVNPGQFIDLSVGMTAPDSSGDYQGYWKIRNGAGTLFGIGAEAQTSFWVRIRVAGPSYTAYDFATSSCDAAWQNNNRDLPCPGSEGDSKGYVVELDDPVMENGQIAHSSGLLTVPKDTYGGLITGKYPAIKIRSGDHFRALINCSYKAYSCSVVFRLDYQIGGGDTIPLGRWNEAHEGKYFPVDVDLSSLAGQNVKFILTVSANGNSNGDLALWVGPRIARAGAPPTDTPTFTPTATPTFTPTATATPTMTPTATATSTP